MFSADPIRGQQACEMCLCLLTPPLILPVSLNSDASAPTPPRVKVGQTPFLGSLILECRTFVHTACKVVPSGVKP